MGEGMKRAVAAAKATRKPPRQLSGSLEQAIRSRIRRHFANMAQTAKSSLESVAIIHVGQCARVDALNWVLTQAGLEPEKE